MAIVGINITKINAERKESKGGKININNNISISSVESKDLALGQSKQKGLRFNLIIKDLDVYTFFSCRDCQVWSKAQDLRSCHSRVRGFESHSRHHLLIVVLKLNFSIKLN